MNKRLIVLLCLIILMTSCTRMPLSNKSDALRPAAAQPIQDDLEIQSLVSALEHQVKILENTKGALNFGPKIVDAQKYASALRTIISSWSAGHSPEKVYQYIQDNFDFYEVYGQDHWGQVLVTAYFEPRIAGSLKPSAKFSQAIYQKPSDLIAIDLSDFDSKFSDERKFRGRLKNKRLVPYYSREEIDVHGALAGQGLEICWVDPIDAFFLHIQGSGTILLENGSEIKLNYSDKNGWPYKAIGSLLTEFIPLNEMSLDRIEAYLRNLSAADRQKYMNQNPSYIFFAPSKISSVTSSGAPATAGRTIATDKRFFPRGALAYLQFDAPPEVKSLKSLKVSRLVADQDAGGAILGGGRVDLFWGHGEAAKHEAGSIKQKGRLWYLLPKEVSND